MPKPQRQRRAAIKHEVLRQLFQFAPQLALRFGQRFNFGAKLMSKSEFLQERPLGISASGRPKNACQ